MVILILPIHSLVSSFYREMMYCRRWWVWQPRVELVVNGVLYPHVHSVMLQSASSLRYSRCGLAAWCTLLHSSLHFGKRPDDGLFSSTPPTTATTSTMFSNQRKDWLSVARSSEKTGSCFFEDTYSVHPSFNITFQLVPSLSFAFSFFAR